MTRTGSLPLIVALLPLLLILSGCSDDRALTVATPWDRITCEAFETSLREAQTEPPPRLDWVRLDPWDSPSRLLESGRAIDLLIGWPPEILLELDQQGLLDLSVEGSSLLLPTPPGSSPAIGPRPPFPIGDPRIDPFARATVASLLSRGDGRAGYASLIVSAGRSEAPDALGPADPPASLPASAALVPGSTHPAVRPFLDSLRSQATDDPMAPSDLPIMPLAFRILAAELIGATAIDSEPELRHAWSVVEHSADAEIGRAALVEPPPWPPSSIQRLQDDPGRRSLIETLASAIVDDPEARAWLLDSWQGPDRPIDRLFLDELASAGGGRLLESPRVLPWLRAEWSSWARQRDSQIARELRPDAEEVPR